MLLFSFASWLNANIVAKKQQTIALWNSTRYVFIQASLCVTFAIRNARIRRKTGSFSSARCSLISLFALSTLIVNMRSVYWSININWNEFAKNVGALWLYPYTALQLFVVRLFSAHYKFTSRKCIQTIPHWSLFAIFVGSHAAPKIHSGDILCHTRGRFSTIAPFAIIKLTRSRVSTVSVRYGINCEVSDSLGTTFVMERHCCRPWNCIFLRDFLPLCRNVAETWDTHVPFLMFALLTDSRIIFVYYDANSSVPSFQAIYLQFIKLMKVARRLCSVRCVAFRLKSEINSRYVWLADRSPG